MEKNVNSVSLVEVSGPDWRGLYVNGELYAENHTLKNDVIFGAVKGTYVEDFRCLSAYEWFEEHEDGFAPASFPTELEELEAYMGWDL